MIILHDLEAAPQTCRGGAVTIGNFDGVHLGHARIVAKLIEQARRVDGPACVFTFDPHPVRLLRPDEAPPPLTWTRRKGELLGELGVDAMIVYPTDRALLAASPSEFFQRIVVNRLAARAVVEGPNFRFGRDREGTPEMLAEWCAAEQIELVVVGPLEIAGAPVSSSRVRRLVAEGAVDEAAQLLTCPYRIRGMVTHGAGRGAGLGFPTANIEGIDTLTPAAGVYAARAHVTSDGPVNSWPAAVNIGPSPTFGESQLRIEAHLLDFDGDLYGKVIELDFLKRLREIRAFATVDRLVEQLQRDVAATRRVIEQQP